MITGFKFESQPDQNDLAALAEFIVKAEEDHLSPALLRQREVVAQGFAFLSGGPITEAAAARYQAMRLFVRG